MSWESVSLPNSMCLVGLVGAAELLAHLCGVAEDDDEQSGGRRIEGSAVTDLLDVEASSYEVHDIVLVQSLDLSTQHYAAWGKASHLCHFSLLLNSNPIIRHPVE